MFRLALLPRIIAFQRGRTETVWSNRQGSCRNHNMSNINNAVTSVWSCGEPLSASLLSLGSNRHTRPHTHKRIISNNRQPSAAVASVSPYLLGSLSFSLSLCVCFLLRSLRPYGCAQARTRTQPLKQELMNLHDFSPAACSALWGFALSVSPLLFSPFLSSLSLSVGSVRGGCPHLLSGKRRAKTHTHTHTVTQA